jgi:phage baseplate assembly protein W
MANKIINISSTSTNLSSAAASNYQLYADISMDSIKVAGKNKVCKDVNINAVKNSLYNIFTWKPGERVLLPEFGSKLYQYLYQGITDTNRESIVSEIRYVIQQWEPRVNIVEVVNATTDQDKDDNTVHLEIIYTIPSLSKEQYNYSFIYNRTSI